MASRYDPLIDNQRILGANFIKRLNDPAYPLITVGRIKYTKHSFVQKFGVANLVAAARLQGIATQLKINVMDFFTWSPREVAECEGLGVTCVYVLCAIAPAHGIAVDDWYSAPVTFDTIKDNLRKEHGMSAEEKRAHTAKAKKHAALAEAGTHALKQKGRNGQRLARSA